MKFDQYLLGRSRDEHVRMFVVVCVDLRGLCSPGKGFTSGMGQPIRHSLPPLPSLMGE